MTALIWCHDVQVISSNFHHTAIQTISQTDTGTHMRKERKKERKKEPTTASTSSLNRVIRLRRSPSSVFPEGGTVQRVCGGLQPSSVVTFKILASHSTDGHLVEVTELEQELDSCGAAARDGSIVSNTPVLPLGIWTNNTLNEAYTVQHIHYRLG